MTGRDHGRPSLRWKGDQMFGTFAVSCRNVPITSLHRSVRLCRKIFYKFRIREPYKKSLYPFQLSLKWDKSYRYLTWGTKCVSALISSLNHASLGGKKFSETIFAGKYKACILFPVHLIRYPGSFLLNRSERTRQTFQAVLTFLNWIKTWKVSASLLSQCVLQTSQ